MTRNDLYFIKSTRDNLQKKFKMKDLEELRSFLGIEFARTKAEILMNQRKYVLDLIVDSGLGGAKLVFTPLECNQKLTSAEFDESIMSACVNDSDLVDAEPYQMLVGGYYISP